MSAAATTAGARTGSTLRRRLTALLVTTGALLGLVLVVAGFVLSRALTSQHEVTEVYFDAVTRADSAYVRLVDAETAVRGFALTGDEITLEPYDRSREADVTFTVLADELAQTTPDAELVADARAAADAADRWHTEFAQPIIAQVRNQGGEAVSATEVEAGRVLFDEARSAIEAYLTELRKDRATAVAELETWTAATGALVLLLVAGAVAMGVSLSFALRRWILLPLTDLGQATRAVTQGDLGHVVRVEGPGEIEQLASDVEQMRLGLVTQLAELRSSREEIAEAHQRLTEQAEELRRSNRDLEQFAYVASHDLQEPLRKVASFTQLLQKRYGGQLDERADQYIDFAVDGAKRMQRLIQDLLGFSRVGRVGGEVVDVDLAAALARAQDQLSERIEESGAVVTHDELPVVRGEEPLLVQLFQNLVGNAVKFRHPDRPPRVHVSAHRVEGAWEIELRDNGIGIEAQYVERVFVIFQRLHAKDLYEGTGIGLALCKKIVEFHGGRIWIPETEHEGTTIRWTLPVADDETPGDGDEGRS
ncbi:ATP-binding protein [Cellulomonas sp. KH9]|uniref:sensor histidine kinase n=1 Tax=Cellulomonas sp. KH9 TaxID=1855324 RepID=UPI0008EEA898|nr:ATP-binding protein [Cellulomonas sp. KH9]SFK36677.1 HAMP domain-containing protein [Cellulomonas sp. KH9]